MHTYSTFAQPPVTTLIHLPDHKVVKTLADNAALKKKLAALRHAASGVLPRRHRRATTPLDGWCIKPPDFDPAKKYPVLFYVYGEPAGQTVLDRWDGKQLPLAQHAGPARIRRHERRQPRHAGAARPRLARSASIARSASSPPPTRPPPSALCSKSGPTSIPTRIAIWGWSGGGSMTLNAIFRYPDLYQTAMAVAPVPDQRHYDTIYQERYMGLPADNVEGYRNGSPIHFAKQLKGNLLIVHGTGDDNCHYLGVETLIDELIAHNKPFTMMAYPNRSHSINEGRKHDAASL